MVNPVQIYSTLNTFDNLRTANEKRRDSALRRNKLKTLAKGALIYTAIPFSTGAVMLSGFESEYKTVTYKIPKILQKSPKLEEFGTKIAKGFYSGIEKAAEFLKKPKYQQFIEKSDDIISKAAEKVFKKESELKYVKGGMTTAAIFYAGTALLGLTAVKHFVNRHNINKEYHKKQEQISRYQFRAVANQLSDL